MRINFVILNETEERLEHLRRLQPSRDWMVFNDGVHAWILQTFLVVGERLGATLSARFASDAINIIHNSQLLRCRERPQGIVVGVRADYPRSRYSYFEIVQNRNQISLQSVWMPHWPQQGLIPTGRAGQEVQRVGYFGRDVNHYSRLFHFPSGLRRVRKAIEDCCTEAGLEFISKGPDRWNDYYDIDIAIGIRAFGRRGFDTKPPTKLFNAWQAMVPFIGGADSAFRQVGRHGKNYLCASDEEQLLSCLLQLKNKSGLYTVIVKDGKSLSDQYSSHVIADRWTSLLEHLCSSASSRTWGHRADPSRPRPDHPMAVS